ncbi:MAG: sulfurtransferase TusA family protein [Candidatus Poribacteria bacterium]|nr:sulfurtransferase TusA family protein [Candidatus Poribacteria bacterium]
MAEIANRALAEKIAQITPETKRYLDVFDIDLNRYINGQVDEKVFTEFRLRHGVYGQRQEGVQMIRIKIPYGAVTSEQMYELADIAEEYADSISHVTTRQDIQLHFVKIIDTPALMTRLAAVGITTEEACGNVVRNVTGCPKAGVCPDQTFDVTPYAHSLAYFLLGHPELQNFGRKFKIAFSGCTDHGCGLANMHDIGAVAAVKDGKRGFKLMIGGGLGAVPHQAKVFEEFLPEEELLPISQAIGRVFTQHGERKSRMKARLKFLVAKQGLDEFKRLVYEEREKLEYDPTWTDFLVGIEASQEQPLKPPTTLNGAPRPEGFDRWYKSNVIKQHEEGYVSAQVTLPLGDITSDQLRALADVCDKYIKDTVRLTVPQNILVRWISEGDLIDFYNDLQALELESQGAEGLSDVLACPGTDSCKLGIASSRGLAATLRDRLDGEEYDDVRDMSIKISGCPNSCGQHHIADIGFFGSSKRVGGHVSPHFQVVLGGQSKRNAEAYGLAVGKVPSKNAPAFVEKMLDIFRAEKEAGEEFPTFVRRIGKARIKDILSEFDNVPDFEDGPEYYQDWMRPEEFSLQSGEGECAGELVELVQFMLTEADRFLYEASLNYEKGAHTETAELCVRAMLRSADALRTTRGLQPAKPETTVREFTNLFVDPGTFFAATAEYLSKWLTRDTNEVDEEQAHFAIEEATLFVEQAYNVYGRMQIQQQEEEEARQQKRMAAGKKYEKEQAAAAPETLEIVDSLDLKGVECPFNYVQTKLRLETMEAGQLLEITIDEGEPIRNVPKSLQNDGHEIVDTKKIGALYRLVIRKA